MPRRGHVVALCLLCLYACAQTPPSRLPTTTGVLDAEATAVVSATQEQLKKLPAERKAKISLALKDRLPATPWLGGKPVTLNSVLALNPSKLTLSEKNGLLLNIQRIQQLVDPVLTPSPVTSGNVDAILAAFQASSPLTPEEVQAARIRLAALPSIAKSVGRVLWLDPVTGNWELVGTVFVTQKNVVATACHVVANLSDVSGGQVVLKQDVKAVVDFSEADIRETGTLPDNLHTYPITGILAMGSGQGCDVGLLRIAGADSIPPIVVSNGTAPPKRMLVLGYPLMVDLKPDWCKYTLDPTERYFCQFHAANPAAAKVNSPGNLYSTSSHDGISVLTYNANTRGGQSGSPVLDFDTLQVAGVHYCCTGSAAMTYSLGCATWHPQNLKWNEAIDVKTILADAALRSYFATQ